MSEIAQHMETLNVSHGATAAEIKASWRAAVKKSHPDLTGSETTQEMVRINAAYQALKDGVPSRQTRQQTQSEPYRDSARSFSPNPCSYFVDDEMLQEWKDKAILAYEQGLYEQPASGIFDKLRGRSSMPRVLFPSRFSTIGNSVLVSFPSRLPKGKIDLYFPHLGIEDEELRIRSDFEIFTFNSPYSGYRFSQSHIPRISDAVFENDPCQVFVGSI